MDLKSIVRVFKFNELQSQAERDPSARRPPTIKFLGVALLLGLLLVLAGFWMDPSRPAESRAGALELSPTPSLPGPGNATTPVPTARTAGDGPEAGGAEDRARDE